MKKARVIIATIGLAFLLGGCLGPNSTANSLRNWNAEVTENKWANEGIFVLTSPVHFLAWVGDVLIFNSWEFWTGKPLWKSDPGAYPKTAGTGG